MRRRLLLAAVPALAMPSIARASDEEVRVGNIMPYSGPASALSEVGKTEAAYIKMLNDNGGINGRRLAFITLDDGYSPPKAVEHARRLVEQDRVALMFSPLGTPRHQSRPLHHAKRWAGDPADCSEPSSLRVARGGVAKRRRGHEHQS